MSVESQSTRVTVRTLKALSHATALRKIATTRAIQEEKKQKKSRGSGNGSAGMFVKIDQCFMNKTRKMESSS